MSIISNNAKNPASKEMKVDDQYNGMKEAMQNQEFNRARQFATYLSRHLDKNEYPSHQPRKMTDMELSIATASSGTDIFWCI